MFIKVVFFLIILLVVSCGTLKTDKPVTSEYVKPEIIQPESSINIPITINLVPYFKETEKSVPKTFEGLEQNCQGVSYTYFFKRNPITFSGHKNVLSFGLTGEYWLKLNYCPQCTDIFATKGNCVVPRIYASCGVGEPLRKMQIAYSTMISLNKDYSIKTKTELSQLEALDPCEVTFIHYDATDQLKKEVKKELTALEKEIDTELQSIDLRKDMEEAWFALQEPIEVKNYGYLYLNPGSPALSKINLENTMATMKLNLQLKPRFSSQKNIVRPQKLPNLSEYRDRDGFNIKLDFSLKYDSLSSMFTKIVEDSIFIYKNKRIIIDSITVYSAGKNKVNLMVKISGSKKGILYLNGTPVFHSSTQELSFPDLQFDVKTRSVLLKSAKWILNSRVEEELRKLASFNLNDEMKVFQGIIEEGLNSEIAEGVHMSGKLESLLVEDIYPMHDELFLRLFVKGQLSLSL